MFVGERSFSKSWGLRASISFAPFPLPPHSFFFLLSSQLSRRTRGKTLAMQARPTCKRGFGIGEKIRCGFRFFGVFLCCFAVFGPPLRPPLHTHHIFSTSGLLNPLCPNSVQNLITITIDCQEKSPRELIK